MWALLGRIIPHPWLVHRDSPAWLADLLGKAGPALGLGRERGEEEERRQQQSNRHWELELSLQVAAGAQGGTNQQGRLKKKFKKEEKIKPEFLTVTSSSFFFLKSSLEALSI